ncbi:hypothetical protein DPMN_045182 [Dreissena polymorpha]|uniref:Nucleoside-diphosphate kinase n=2 Tax=Dreissena polymorpha TaxID=45954 RepID=A0A9D4D5R9_DREPO|nr:hypothetical protein DPMN_045182 [Dreissena polymorpha]
MRNELNDIFDTDTNKLAAVTDTMDEILIPKIDVDSTRKPHIVRYILNKKLKPIIDARQSMFERVYPISEKLAMKMLATGYKQPSRFGRWCPVRVKEGDCIQTMSGPGYTMFPCIYRSHVYFLSSPQAREEFVSDPIKYVSQPTPKPVVPIKIAVIGPPKSGKTTLANRFAQEYGLLRLSIGEAMRMVMTSQPKAFLSLEMQKHLVKGLTVPDELAVQALEMCLLDMRCQTRGYVLDGYPQTQRQVELLTERCLIPFRVIEIDVKSKEIMVRGTKDRIAAARIQPLHDSAQILAVKLGAYNRNIGVVRQWYETEHMNYRLMDGERSKWWVWNTALDLARESVRQIQTYLQRISDGKAASIADMCITPSDFLQRVGDYEQYCPVSLALRGELLDCSTNKTLEFAVEFRGHYYKCAGKTELEQFLAEPEKYVPPLAPNKLPPPSRLPRRRTPTEVKASATIELNSYCPVTYLDGKCRYEAITPGNPEFIAEYVGKYWYCQSEEKLLRFMKLPEQYASLKLPHKLPPTKESLTLTSLPMLGYMEQTVATALVKAMTACGTVKPKYPFLSPSRSALFYIAYHLKAFNPKSSDYIRKKYKKKLDRFEETCSLIKYLGNTMTVRYKEPQERPADFDVKLQTFFALRGIEPTPTWIS